MAGSAEALEEEALRRFDSSFRYLHGKALGHFLHLGRKSLDILTRIQYSCINKSSCLVFSWVLSALPVQLPMPGIGAKPNLYCKAIELVCGGSPKVCVLVEWKALDRVKSEL